MNGDDGHRPVLLHEAVAALGLAAGGGGIYVDATFGRGGHGREILARLAPSGVLLVLDRDPAAIEGARGIADARLRAVRASFSRLGACLREAGIEAADGILFDLGISSPQLDDAGRGFSFRFDAPLDMRMDPGQGESAAAWLAHASEDEIRRVVKDYGEERFAHAVAKAIVAARTRQPVATTGQLAAIVEKAVRTRELGQHPATRTFQALRIHTNQELEELALALPQALAALRRGGRLVVISFHSLEDRIVKRFMREAARPSGPPAKLPLRASELPRPTARIVGRPVVPGAAELAANPRARSARMRVLEKL